jgi:hypothetical protein
MLALRFRRRHKANQASAVKDLAGVQPVKLGDLEAVFMGMKPNKMGTRKHTKQRMHTFPQSNQTAIVLLTFGYGVTD